ncbi:MAG: rRNA pseudouridine synthase [Acidobacteria bacterium]|nr:rRNA pseudouridine synthase [Acidobacteriota bacterium]
METRLQKLIADAGIASRRHAEELIAAGEVTVNGKVITELGTKADPERDHIKVRGKLINRQLAARENVYVLLNKPRGFLTSLSDPENRPLITELFPPALGRLHPVGRLDFNTEGLLIMTNDGELTNYVTAARNHVRKVYEAKVKGVPSEDQIERLRRGIRLEDGTRTAPAEVKSTGYTATNAWFEVVLFEGRNQQIRRMFDAVGHSVLKLKRVRIGHVTNEGLPLGHWRYLTPEEVARLKGGPKKGAVRGRQKSAGKSSKEVAGKPLAKADGAASKKPARKAAAKRGTVRGASKIKR